MISPRRFVRTVLEHKGVQEQMDKVKEELCELQLELIRIPYGRSDRNKVLEEYADVLLVGEYLREIFMFTDSEINEVIQGKMKRTLDEIAKGVVSR